MVKAAKIIGIVVVAWVIYGQAIIVPANSVITEPARPVFFMAGTLVFGVATFFAIRAVVRSHRRAKS